MTLDALQRLLTAAGALADDRQFLVLGSASLLASFPELGAPDAPLASTYDADICPEPFDELTGTMLDEALGENRAYYQRHGYHADILRDSIFETLPSGWRDRLVSVPGCRGARALDPHDLAAIKLVLGRPKDLSLVSTLAKAGLLDQSVVKTRIQRISLSDPLRVRADMNFRSIFQ